MKLKKLLEDQDLFCVYALADRLHKTAGEILGLPALEVMGWLVYINQYSEHF